MTLFELSSHEECKEWQVCMYLCVRLCVRLCMCLCVCMCVWQWGWCPGEGWAGLGRILPSATPCTPLCEALLPSPLCSWRLGDCGREFGRPGRHSVEVHPLECYGTEGGALPHTHTQDPA